ncbi:hypothetical protein OHC33_008883 [Knufia fluminis]|uniref:Uncharacterized protein n=1 Tax=Knufia fluminis TaxID=191047 RepID=A0AAN8EFA4_9EURO|nr:hypothetical protein OHC33_008883 [Knufia fluminis]
MIPEQADMVFYSDDSTLINSDPELEPESSPVPPSNYLWQSPYGDALPGRQHQLLLHLLSLDQSWIWRPELGFSTIRTWLRDFFPAYIVRQPVLRAIAAEYVLLDEDHKSAYRGMAPLFDSWPRQGQHADAPVGLMAESDLQEESTWDGLIDPALFEKPQHAKTTNFWQTPAQTRVRAQVPYSFVTPTEAAIHDGSPMKDRAGKMTIPFTKTTISARNNQTTSTPIDCLGVTKTSYHLSSSLLNLKADSVLPPSTPSGRTTIAESPRTPEAHRIFSSPSEIDTTMSEQPSPTPKNNMPPDQFGKEPSADDDVVIHEGNAKIYAPVLLKSLVNIGYQVGQSHIPKVDQTKRKDGSMADSPLEEPADIDEPAEVSVEESLLPVEHAMQPLEQVTHTFNKSTLPKPDPSKYKMTSKDNWRIPFSEADKFMAHFNPSVDLIPAKIDGYFWYCDKCYNPKQDRSVVAASSDTAASTEDVTVDADPPQKRRKVVKEIAGGPARGKFSNKRGIEKHMKDQHKTVWRCNILPEPERGVGTMVPSSVTVVDADSAVQGFPTSQTNFRSSESSPPQALTPYSGDKENDASWTPDSVRRKLFQG